jgi:hypothetical protein
MNYVAKPPPEHGIGTKSRCMDVASSDGLCKSGCERLYKSNHGIGNLKNGGSEILRKKLRVKDSVKQIGGQ